jgi:hypothetical protein
MRLALLTVAALLLAGCYPTAVQPNEVDADRLAALAAEPVLAGATQHAAEPNRTSANANAKRAHVSVEQNWSTGGSPETWSLVQELLTELRADDWVVILQNCKATASGLTSAEIVALKELDDFTAGLIVKADDGGAQLEAYAPFHEEEANPWGPLDAQTDGCLDSPSEPDTNTTTTTRTTVGLFYLRDE